MRLSEVYTSTQGEGPRVGVPTVFLRLAGCNLKCPGWPCDTQHAIDPKLYRNEWKELGVEQIFELVKNESVKTGARNIFFTGGEPFLQPLDKLRHLAQLLHNDGMTLEVFTNGTLEWPTWAMYTFKFVMDWKLAGSGERISPLDIQMGNAWRLEAKDAIKFTVVDHKDLLEAYSVWMQFFSRRSMNQPEFFVGPVWDKMEPSQVVDFILANRLPWRLNIQVHKYVWPADARRT